MSNKNIIIHDYFQNFGGGERLVKILCKKKFSYLYIGFDHRGIFKRFFKKIPINLKEIIKINLPLILKKILIIFIFKKISINCKNYICSGNYSLFTNVNSQNKIIYIHSLPKIFFRNKFFYTKFSLNKLTNLFFPNFKKKYLQKVSEFDHILTNSYYTKKQLRKFIKNKITVVYPPIEKLENKKKAKSGNFFLFNNRHEIEKNIEKVLNVFKKIKYEKIYVLSEGSLTKKMKKKFRYVKNIKFTGIVSEDKYIAYLKSCKAVINVSSEEDFGMAALEAMQFGKATFCLNQGGYKETTKHKFNAVHINHKDIERDLEKKISLIKDKDFKRMKNNCLKTSLKFSEKNFLKIINSFLIK